MLKIPKKKYFDTDDDFYNFCVVPQVVQRERIKDNGDVIRSFDFELSNEYYDAVNNNIMFIIKDLNSQIYKHQAVSYRTVTKPVSNLEQYYNL